MVALKPGPIPKQGLPVKEKKRRPIEGPLSRVEYEEAVIKRQMGIGAKKLRCPVSGELLSRGEIHVHHPYEKWRLRRDGLYHLVFDPRNGLAVWIGVHTAHHSGVGEKIPREVLEDCHYEFAAELGEQAIHLVEKAHPAKGSPTR